MLLENDYSTKYEGFDPKSSESYIMFSLTQKVFSGTEHRSCHKNSDTVQGKSEPQ